MYQLLLHEHFSNCFATTTKNIKAQYNALIKPRDNSNETTLRAGAWNLSTTDNEDITDVVTENTFLSLVHVWTNMLPSKVFLPLL